MSTAGTSNRSETLSLTGITAFYGVGTLMLLLILACTIALHLIPNDADFDTTPILPVTNQDTTSEKPTS